VGDWHACGQLADGELRVPGTGAIARCCTDHRAMVEAMLRARVAQLRWERYAAPGRRSEDQAPADAVDGREDQAPADAVDGREDQAPAGASRFTLTYTDADG